MIELVFATGNTNKAKHFEELIGFPIIHKKLNLDEIQSSDATEVVTRKVEQAHQQLQRPVIVDDFSIGFDALDGLPGPFIKFFIEAANGLENLCRMADGLESRKATAHGFLAYCDQDGTRIFHGSIAGSIAKQPRGSADYAYGADPIFEVAELDNRTRAELTRSEYDEVYKTIRPFDELKQFLLAT